MDDEVANIIRLLKKSSPGWDELSPKVMKETSQYFLEPFVHICNLSVK